MTTTETVLEFEGLLDTLGFTDDEFVSVIHWGQRRGRADLGRIAQPGTGLRQQADRDGQRVLRS
jgi:hypothetical protein